MKFYFSICLTVYILLGQSTIIDIQLYRTLQKSMDIVLSANSFHSAEISKRFRFSVSGNFTQINLTPPASKLNFGNTELKTIEYKTLHAFVDLPFYLQAGFHFNFPSAKINDLNTNYSGYSLKLQINQWIWSDLPNLATQISYHKIEINGQLSSWTSSVNLHMSKKIWNIEPYAGILLNRNTTEFGSLTNTQSEVLYKAGLSYQLYIFYFYVETTFHIYNNFSTGLSLKF